MLTYDIVARVRHGFRPSLFILQFENPSHLTSRRRRITSFCGVQFRVPTYQITSPTCCTPSSCVHSPKDLQTYLIPSVIDFVFALQQHHNIPSSAAVLSSGRALTTWHRSAPPRWNQSDLKRCGHMTHMCTNDLPPKSEATVHSCLN